MAREYVEMYGDMGQKSNTIMFQKDAGDVNALLAQAATVFNTSSIFGFIAIILAAINIFGGFLVTQRMLQMYKKKKDKKK